MLKIEVICDCRDCQYHDGVLRCESGHGIIINSNGKCRRHRKGKKQNEHKD